MSWTQGSGSRGGNWQRNQANNAANFFAQPSVNSHPNFRPTRIGTFSSFNEGASGKGPKPPEKPIMPYMRYSRRHFKVFITVFDEITSLFLNNYSETSITRYSIIRTLFWSNNLHLTFCCWLMFMSGMPTTRKRKTFGVGLYTVSDIYCSGRQLTDLCCTWILRKRALDQPISGPILQEKALAFSTKLDIDNFVANSGWLRNLKSRHGIRELKIHGEKLSADRPPKPECSDNRSSTMWDKVRATNPDYKFWDIGKIIGRKWRELPDGEKQIYFDEYELEKQEYEKQMKAYHNSAAFQNYLTQKNKERNEAWRSTQVESSVYVQPIDEESDEIDSNYPRYFSAERYARNQRLLGEIFSAVAVPSANSIVTSERLHTLRSQVSSLTHHLESLRQELKLLQENHKRKKENWESGSELFSKKLKLLDEQRPGFSEEKYAELVKNQKEYLMTSYERYKSECTKEWNGTSESLDANGKEEVTLDKESSSADNEQKESNLEQFENQKSNNDNDGGNTCSSEQCDDMAEETCEITKEDSGKISPEESRNEDQTTVKEEFHHDDDDDDDDDQVPSEVKVEITGDSDQTEPTIETSEITAEKDVDLKEEVKHDNDDEDEDVGDDDDDGASRAVNLSENNTSVENAEETTSEIVQSVPCEIAKTEEVLETEKPENEDLIETEPKTPEEAAGIEANTDEVSDEKDQQ
ncbi:SWI/SNF-related matrix-associated actin-dependent regulator of chromatin subfamily E member 1 [Trichinella spiralis]|uniref:SWI/SNF-related matrix-associated actin-dependent regulator of chromatin subfamily E member 1 n=1 Tax=Trichinella spiralis TaxID=6334 RepID=A0A0V1BPH6_TRISP|nr:SWI/SNF-related matrix-associated actin-dependent regulator of chromatin subfamily E member 1 [Trichinella spiralis]